MIESCRGLLLVVFELQVLVSYGSVVGSPAAISGEITVSVSRIILYLEKGAASEELGAWVFYFCRWEP